MADPRQDRGADLLPGSNDQAVKRRLASFPAKAQSARPFGASSQTGAN